MEDLNDILGTEPATRENGFVIETEKHALWATGKMREAEESLQSLKARYEDYRRQLDEWYQREAQQLQSTVDSMAHMLRPYVAEQIAHGKKKSIRLPDGSKAGFRTTPETVEIVDPDDALEWCIAHAPEAVKVVKTVQTSVLKRRLKGGEPIPPSARVEPGEERFYVDVREADE